MGNKEHKPLTIDTLYDTLEEMAHDNPRQLEDIYRQRNGLPPKKHGRRRKTIKLKERFNKYFNQ
jgi:hypothetical protein